jgi:hypothetical protein
LRAPEAKLHFFGDFPFLATGMWVGETGQRAKRVEVCFGVVIFLHYKRNMAESLDPHINLKIKDSELNLSLILCWN